MPSRPPGPDDARLILELVALPSLRLEHQITRRVLSAIPPEHADFRPEPGARSTIELARHIVAAELRFLSGAVTGTFADASDDVATADIGSLLQLYDREFPVALTRLESWEGDLMRVLDYRGFIRQPALGFVQLAINHTIHHRGQLSVYLRQLGVRVPGIYG